MSRFDGWDGPNVTCSHFWQFQPQEVFFWKIFKLFPFLTLRDRAFMGI